jgi:hypothetical protein
MTDVKALLQPIAHLQVFPKHSIIISTIADASYVYEDITNDIRNFSTGINKRIAIITNELNLLQIKSAKLLNYSRC